MSEITWKLIQLDKAMIKVNPLNPKIRNVKGFRRLEKLTDKYGLIFDGVVNADYTLIDGHSRLELNPNGVGNYFVPSRQLSESEYTELNSLFDLAKAGDADFLLIEDLMNEEQLMEWELEKIVELSEQRGYLAFSKGRKKKAAPAAPAAPETQKAIQKPAKIDHKPQPIPAQPSAPAVTKPQTFVPRAHKQHQVTQDGARATKLFCNYLEYLLGNYTNVYVHQYSDKVSIRYMRYQDRRISTGTRSIHLDPALNEQLLPEISEILEKHGKAIQVKTADKISC